jgi:hypothetical protein
MTVRSRHPASHQARTQRAMVGYRRSPLARRVLGEMGMIASGSSPRSIALADRQLPVLSRLIDHVVGDLIELVVYSVEELRERISRTLR